MSEDARGRMAEIAARANAATEGQWVAFNKNNVVAIGVDSDEPHACDKIVHWHGFDACGVPIQDQRRNVKFIAHARADIPWLLEQLRAAQAEIATDHAREEKITQALEAVVAEERKLCAKNARLRAVVDAARDISKTLTARAAAQISREFFDAMQKLADAIAALDAAEGKKP